MESLEVGKRYRIVVNGGEVYEGDFAQYLNGAPVFSHWTLKVGDETRVWDGRPLIITRSVQAEICEAH